MYMHNALGCIPNSQSTWSKVVGSIGETPFIRGERLIEYICYTYIYVYVYVAAYPEKSTEDGDNDLEEPKPQGLHCILNRVHKLSWGAAMKGRDNPC